MHVVIGADQGGYDLKRHVAEYLIAQGYQVEDVGTYSLESVDYPDIAAPLARAVATGEFERGILICGTGIGMSMAANKIHGVRAAVCVNSYMARMARQDNDANILCMGGRVVGPGLALDIVQTFLESEFAAGRHARRVSKIGALEDGQNG